MRYIWFVSGKESVEDIQNKILEVAPSTEHAMASAAEQLIQEGVRRGKVEGKAEGKAEDVLVILEARQLTVTAEQRAHILACKDVAQLERWLRQAVTAGSTHELFPH
jgi:flagellar biosynthesis/type III secretory pathway protein FliH